MWIHIFAQQVNYTRKVEKCPIVCYIVYIEALPPQLVFKKVFSHISEIKPKTQEISLTHVPVSYETISGHSSLPAYCNRRHTWVVACSIAYHGKYLGIFIQLPNHWKKLGLYKAFSNVKVHREACLWQHCWASVVCIASYSFQWASWPCPSTTKEHPARLEHRKDPLFHMIRRSGLQSVLWIAWR